jgi:outer membrane protein assembly factor BamB
MSLLKKVSLLSVLFILLFTSQVKANSGDKLWYFKTEGQIWSSIKIKQNTAYFGSDDGYFYAVDIVKNTLRWKYKTAGKIRSTASFSKEQVFFSSDDGYLYGVNQRDGKLIFQRSLNDHNQVRTLPDNKAPWLFDYGKSSPVVDGNTVYIGSADQSFYAFNSESGELLWTFKAADSIRSTADFNESSVFISSLGGNTYAINKKTGELQWTHSSATAITSNPKVLKNKVLIGSRDAHLYALNAATGKVEWKYHYTDGSWVESSAIAGESKDVFYIASSDAKRLSKFNLDTGKELWSFKTSGWSWGTPVLENGVVYIGSVGADEYWTPVHRGFFAVDAITGKLRWQYQPEKVSEGYIHGGVHGSVAISEGKILIPDVDGSVYVVAE